MLKTAVKEKKQLERKSASINFEYLKMLLTFGIKTTLRTSRYNIERALKNTIVYVAIVTIDT